MLDSAYFLSVHFEPLFLTCEYNEQVIEVNRFAVTRTLSCKLVKEIFFFGGGGVDFYDDVAYYVTA